MNSNPDTRASLIARIRDSGDDAAWQEFVQIYQPVVQRFVQRHGLQYADAAEITQEVLSRVAKSIENWSNDQENGTFRGWLYRITSNQTIDFLRKRQRERSRTAGQDAGLSQVADPTASQSSIFQAEYEQQLFYWAAEKLKPKFKPINWQAFWMSSVEGLSIDEVAKRLEIEYSSVYVARCRIMAKLSSLVQMRLNETNIPIDPSRETK